MPHLAELLDDLSPADRREVEELVEFFLRRGRGRLRLEVDLAPGRPVSLSASLHGLNGRGA